MMLDADIGLSCFSANSQNKSLGYWTVLKGKGEKEALFHRPKALCQKCGLIRGLNRRQVPKSLLPHANPPFYTYARLDVYVLQCMAIRQARRQGLSI